MPKARDISTDTEIEARARGSADDIAGRLYESYGLQLSDAPLCGMIALRTVLRSLIQDAELKAADWNAQAFVMRWPAELLPQLYWLIGTHWHDVMGLESGRPVPSRIDPSIAIQIDRSLAGTLAAASDGFAPGGE